MIFYCYIVWITLFTGLYVRVLKSKFDEHTNECNRNN